MRKCRLKTARISKVKMIKGEITRAENEVPTKNPRAEKTAEATAVMNKNLLTTCHPTSKQNKILISESYFITANALYKSIFRILLPQIKQQNLSRDFLLKTPTFFHIFCAPAQDK